MNSSRKTSRSLKYTQLNFMFLFFFKQKSQLNLHFIFPPFFWTIEDHIRIQDNCGSQIRLYKVPIMRKDFKDVTYIKRLGTKSCNPDTHPVLPYEFLSTRRNHTHTGQISKAKMTQVCITTLTALDKNPRATLQQLFLLKKLLFN